MGKSLGLYIIAFAVESLEFGVDGNAVLKLIC
jgi:hypothetical protein